MCRLSNRSSRTAAARDRHTDRGARTRFVPESQASKCREHRRHRGREFAWADFGRDADPEWDDTWFHLPDSICESALVNLRPMAPWFEGSIRHDASGAGARFAPVLPGTLGAPAAP